MCGDFSPQREGPLPGRVDTGNRVEGVTNDGSHLAVTGHEIRLEELREGGGSCPFGDVVHRDEAVSLPATEGGLGTDDGVLGTLDLGTVKAAEGSPQEAFQPDCRVGDGEELLGVPVDGVGLGLPDNLVEVGSEHEVRKLTFEHVFPRSARLGH
ncbi:MAG: hypothetical protein ACLQPH_19610 [Acidimicrobiales bacterium]